MSASAKYTPDAVPRIELHNGDCLEQSEFHQLYEKMPEGFRAELVDGICYVSEPLGLPHSKHDCKLISLLVAYEAFTPGVEVGGNVTVILTKKDEVQPDAMMRILPQHNGQSGNAYDDLYVQGAPELMCEVAFSSRALDLHKKKERYEKSGVLEYIVVCLKPLQLYWFDLREKRKLTVDNDGIFRSKVFPGLWIREAALLNNDYKLSMEVLQHGLAADEHARFVQQLAGGLTKGEG